MAYLNPLLIEVALNFLISEADQLHLTEGEPRSFDDAMAGIAMKTGVMISPPYATSTGGRMVRIMPFDDGKAEMPGKATHWSLVSSRSRLLLSVGLLDAPVQLSAGNLFKLSSTEIGWPIITQGKLE